MKASDGHEFDRRFGRAIPLVKEKGDDVRLKAWHFSLEFTNLS